MNGLPSCCEGKEIADIEFLQIIGRLVLLLQFFTY